MAVEAQRVNDEAQLSSGSSTDQKHGGESSGVVLQSPTSVTPVEGAPIFSMPRTEVSLQSSPATVYSGTPLEGHP